MIYEEILMKIFIEERTSKTPSFLANRDKILKLGYEYHVIKLNESFSPGNSSFYLVSNVTGLSILDLPMPEESTGIFSCQYDPSYHSVTYKNEKLMIKPESKNSDEMFYVGGAFFTNDNEELTETYENFHSFLCSNISRLRITHSLSQEVGALFLDRDGVINEDCGYPSSVKDIKIFDEIVPIIKFANQKSIPVIVVTNQSGIARGFLNEGQLHEIHQHISEYLKNKGAFIDDYLFCPYHIKATVPEFAKESLLRKPYPLMGLIAGEKYKIDYAKSLMIGDKYSDVLYSLGIDTLVLESPYLKGKQIPKQAKVVGSHEEAYQILSVKFEG